MIFSESEFLTEIPVLDARFEYLESYNNNLFYLFNDQVNYTLANHFAKSETTKCNVTKFLTNLLIKPIIKKISYYNANE